MHVRLAAGIVIISLVFGAWCVYPVFKLRCEHQEELQSLEAQLDSVKQRNVELREELDELSTPEGVEQLARESLGYVKSGEDAYVVITEDSAETLSADLSSEDSLWKQAIDFVFGFE